MIKKLISILLLFLSVNLLGCAVLSSHDTTTLDGSCLNECGASKKICYHADTNSNMIGPDMENHKPRTPGMCQAEYHQCLKACRKAMR